MKYGSMETQISRGPRDQTGPLVVEFYFGAVPIFPLCKTVIKNTFPGECTKEEGGRKCNKGRVHRDEGNKMKLSLISPIN